MKEVNAQRKIIANIRKKHILIVERYTEHCDNRENRQSTTHGEDPGQPKDVACEKGNNITDRQH